MHVKIWENFFTDLVVDNNKGGHMINLFVPILPAHALRLLDYRICTILCHFSGNFYFNQYPIWRKSSNHETTTPALGKLTGLQALFTLRTIQTVYCSSLGSLSSMVLGVDLSRKLYKTASATAFQNSAIIF